jgi:energy-coupling factor transporter ATP-binding protein EcfA2
MSEYTIEALREDTARLIEELRAEEEAKKHAYRKYLVNGYEMLLNPSESIDCLVEPLLARAGVAALVGSSDSGKSTLLRGLAMAVASQAKHYLGFEIKARYNRAIYVATEDDESAISSLMHRQLEELYVPKEAFEGLDFIFDTENLIDNLDKNLEERPADLVVVDAFADLYTGPMNENNRVRSFLNLFSQLAHKHNTLFIFLHHTGKRTESLTPSKHNAIGSQGFEAKMRVMMELRPDPVRHDIRHLCVVKGNYLSEEYKHDSFELRFTSALNFEATGNRVPFAMLKERDTEKESAEAERLELIKAMREEGKTLQEIADTIGVSVSTVHRHLQKIS